MSNETPLVFTHDERRCAARLPRHESVSIQVMVPCIERPNCLRVLTSETRDLSRNGLCLLLSEPLERERILDLCVAVRDYPRRFLLTGETRWCRSDPDGSYEVGLLIHDGDGTDYQEWSALFNISS